MEKILTVTVPTYNVESYLEQCLESFIIGEKMNKIEVLIINDGSTDSSEEIALKYVKKYPETFRLINKSNGGHGSTINQGIQEANGKYFKVVDSDDWVDKDAMNKLIDMLEEVDSDLVYTNYYWYNNNTGELTVEFPKPFETIDYGKEYNFEEIKENFYLKMHGYNIKTEILRQIPQIDEHCFYVDTEYVLYPIVLINTVSFLDEFTYFYRIGLKNQSMSPEKLRKNADNFDLVLKRMFIYYERCKEYGISESRIKYLEHALGRLISSRFKIFLCNPYNRKVKLQMKKFDHEIYKKYPQIYKAVINKVVLCLRKSGYNLYGLAHLAFYIKENGAFS